MYDALYDAILFDLDGTLIDTESVALVTGIAAFAAAGLRVDEAFMHGLVGKDEPTAATIVRAAFPGADLAAIHAHWRAGFDAGIAADLRLKPGVEAVLDATSGFRRAIVTSTGRAGAHRKLAQAGIAPHFDTVITLDDVTRPKPAPDPYVLAAERIGVAVTRCLVFEDSETGAEAAHRAGCIVVQVPDVVPSEGRWAHHLADDLIAGARLAGLRIG